MQVIIPNDKKERDELFKSLALDQTACERKYRLEAQLCEMTNKSSYGKFIKNTTGAFYVPTVFIR